jgi:tRNA-splicing ligase RtcB
MDLSRFERQSDYEWLVKPHGRMQVPAVIFASRELMEAMD